MFKRMCRAGTGRHKQDNLGGSSRRPGRRRSQRVLGLLAALLVVVGVLTVPTVAQGATGDVGIEGPSHVGTGTPTGTKRAESVLWFNDGYWWGNLWDTRTSDFHIFRFDAAGLQWVDTGVATETRSNTHHDVLWDGTTLYVASHLFVADGVAAAPGFPSTLRRYSYNTSTKTYTSLGSSQINTFKTETLVIDKDTTGQLWATWQQDNQIYVNTTGTDGTTWGTPFPLPGGDVSQDDNSSLVAFGPGKMGVMWSRQSGSPSTATDGFYWSVHADGAGTTAWSAVVPVATGAKQGDDHMNLKWLDSSGGRVFAAVKTSFTSAAQPLIELLAMDSAGSWTRTTIATVSECPNRVVLLIDEAAQRLRTFATYPKPSGATNAGVCSSSGGAIYEKSTPLSNISFTTDKTPRIVDADEYVHNVSSTKQNLNNARIGGASTTGSGLMAIADVNATSTYWSYFEPGATTPPVDTVAPETTITVGPVGTVSATDASFEFSSSEVGSSFECRLDAGAFGACTSPKAYTGLAQGSHTFAVRATDAAGNTDATPDTRTWTVDTSPTAVLAVSSPSGTAPLEVSADASGSSDPQGQQLSYAFDWGDGSSTGPQSAATAAHTFAAAGSYTVKVTVTNTSGLTATAGQTVTVQPGPAYVGQRGSASSTTAAKTGVVTLDSDVAAGDMVVVTAHVTVGASKPVTATDPVGNIYTVATSKVDGTGAKLSVLYGRATMALPAGSKITLSFASGTAYRIVVDELTGVTTLDKNAVATGSSSRFASGSTKTTSAARELVLGVVALTGGSAAPSWASGWTLAGSAAVGTSYVGRAYRTPSSIGTFEASGTTTGNWTAGVVTFR